MVSWRVLNGTFRTQGFKTLDEIVTQATALLGAWISWASPLNSAFRYERWNEGQSRLAKGNVGAAIALSGLSGLEGTVWPATASRGSLVGSGRRRRRTVRLDSGSDFAAESSRRTAATFRGDESDEVEMDLLAASRAGWRVIGLTAGESFQSSRCIANRGSAHRGMAHRPSARRCGRHHWRLWCFRIWALRFGALHTGAM